MSLRIKSKFWIEDDQGRPVFGGGKARILNRIQTLGSIKAAAEDLGMSYRAVWGKIRAAEARLGFKLIEASPGGGPNRGALLTPEARRLLDLFQEFSDLGNSQADNLFARLFGDLSRTDPAGQCSPDTTIDGSAR